MVFFVEDVHLLASVSLEGRVFVWKISEGPDEDDKPHNTGNIVIVVQILGEDEYVHPRVCWHRHKQEITSDNRIRQIKIFEMTYTKKKDGSSMEQRSREKHHFRKI